MKLISNYKTSACWPILITVACGMQVIACSGTDNLDFNFDANQPNDTQDAYVDVSQTNKDATQNIDTSSGDTNKPTDSTFADRDLGTTEDVNNTDTTVDTTTDTSANTDAETSVDAGIDASMLDSDTKEPCRLLGASCASAGQCCTGACGTGLCRSCISDNQACTSNDGCCSGTCQGAVDGGTGTCKPLNTSCRTSGNTCSSHGECCSSYCENGVCSANTSYCRQTGDMCSTNSQCCGGLCEKLTGAALGVCKVPSASGATNCKIAGEVCGGIISVPDGGISDGGSSIPQCGGECCSRACAPYGNSKAIICQPPTGCRPTGEICFQDSDCCGGPGNPDNDKSNVTCSKAAGASVGRCDNGNACRAAGAICKLATSSCNAENNCCAGNANTYPTACQQDNLGIPRCVVDRTIDCKADAGSRAGQVCASSADCCGLPCVPTATGDGGTQLRCGNNVCIQTGEVCTTDADCCSGNRCFVPAGSSRGTCESTNPPKPDAGPEADVEDAPPPACSLYGQACTVNTDCCNVDLGIQCINKRCLTP